MCKLLIYLKLEGKRVGGVLNQEKKKKKKKELSWRIKFDVIDEAVCVIVIHD